MLAATPAGADDDAHPNVPAPEPDSSHVYETRVEGRKPLHGKTPDRASTRVTRRELEQRLPRSAPDALRYEPGVYVQQTAHGQGSAYIRGRTGQQTVIMFDGIRLNNSTFRQGPNQYFFTIDAHTIRGVEVLRGGASTRYGSDAIGGSIDAEPLQPTLDRGRDGLSVHPSVALGYASSDHEAGGRVQLDTQLRKDLALLGGVGYRRSGPARSAGPIRSPRDGRPPLVPRYANDGTTMLGTGFSELASDGRLVYELRPGTRLTAALYDYRQFDAPRTDKCPPPEAPIDTCLTFEEQFRTLSYLRLDSSLGAAASLAQLTVAYQNQHERRLLDRPSSSTRVGGRDDVHTLGITARLRTRDFELSPTAQLAIDYGADLYRDWIASAAWTSFDDAQLVVGASRGQYLEGSTYTSVGGFALGELRLFDRLVLHAGGRLSGVAARAPADVSSDTRAVDRDWFSLVGQAGARWQALSWLSLLANLDRSFRAPNLDDLTSRQDTGPGFQFENPDLTPESSLTTELGVRVDVGWLQADAWAYWARLADAIERRPRPLADCPLGTARSCVQLVNLDGAATIGGVEGIVRAFLPARLTLRATIAYARGTGPNPADRPTAPSAAYASEVPLSRIPPLNGTLELRWRHPRGFYAGAGLRWATLQPRLSLGDVSDARIPDGGTPGFAVLDLRAGYRLGRRLLLGVALENLTNASYRYHGSSVDGGRLGLVVNLEGRL